MMSVEHTYIGDDTQDVYRLIRSHPKGDGEVLWSVTRYGVVHVEVYSTAAEAIMRCGRWNLHTACWVPPLPDDVISLCYLILEDHELADFSKGFDLGQLHAARLWSRRDEE